jgi:GTPase Era involved in 16S rRNA processing
MNGEDFSEKEKSQAKENGFILGGKTGAGKSTLLNAIIGKELALVKKDANSVTKDTTIYYYKLTNGKMITILDTPGLMDPKALKDPNIDNVHLAQITKTIQTENIKIKGIIFLVNFQEERFDLSEQEALINYNKIFPLKNFWKHILVVFTHYFADPDGDSEEEMKKIKDQSNKKIIGQIMDSVKEVSDVINYNDLNTRYLNSYCPVKNNRQKEKNKKNKEEIEDLLDQISQKEPLISFIETVELNNFPYQENNKYYKINLIIIGYFGLAKKPIKEEKFLIGKNEITDKEYFKLKKDCSNIKIKKIQAEKDNNGNIKTVSKNDPKDSYYKNLFKYSGIGGFIGVSIGTVIAGLIVLSPLGAGAAVGLSLGYGAGGGGLLGTLTGILTGLINK